MITRDNGPVRVLVTVGSKHGATAEIGERIAEGIRHRGHDVVVAPPGEIADIEPFDAIVLGSAVYAGHWMPGVRELAGRITVLDEKPQVWLFSSGPVGDPPKPEGDPLDAADILAETGAREHRVFAGKIDKSKLSLGERAIVKTVRAAEGDFRDWNVIDEWAGHIGETLTREMSRL